MTGPPRVVVSMWAAGELEEHVVERGRAQREVADPDRGVVQGDGDRPDRRRAVVDADGELVAVRLDATTPWTPSSARARRRRRPRCARRSTSVPIVRFSSVGVPSATRRPLSTMPTRSASSSASSRYCVVRRMVMPSSWFRRRTSCHTLRAAERVEAGGGLVEEQHLGVVHERGGEVEPAPHAARVGLDAPVERVADVDERAQLDEALLDLALRGGRRADPGRRSSSRPVCFGSSATSWSATPMRRRTCCGRARCRRPATTACPPVGASSVQSIFTVVDFPAPLGPSRP